MTGLRAVAARGFAWTSGQALFNRALSLVGFIVIARRLTPGEYGIVALANVFGAMFALLAAAGYSQALVQRATVDQEDLDTVFWIGLGTAVVLSLVMVVAAWPLAAVFDEPLLRPVLQVLSLSFVFIAAGATHQAVLQRQLKFRTLALRTVLSSAIATAVGVTLALLDYGVWALVAQSVLAVAIGSITMMLKSGYRPSFHVSRERFRVLFDDSRHFLGSGFLMFLNTRTDDFLIGSVLGSAALGIYSVAYRILLVMLDVLTTTVRQVAFPMFSRMDLDRGRLLRAFSSATRMASTTAAPCFLLALAVAPELVRVVFGEQWRASVPVMQILCLFGVLQAFSQLNGALLSSVGRIRFVFRFGVLNTVVQIAAFAVAAPFGIRYVAASYVLRAYLLEPIGFVVAARELHASALKVAAGILPGLMSSAVMVAAVFGARELVGDALALEARLVMLLAVGALVYVITLRLVGATLYEELLDYVRSALHRGSAQRVPAAEPMLK